MAASSSCMFDAFGGYACAASPRPSASKTSGSKTSGGRREAFYLPSCAAYGCPVGSPCDGTSDCANGLTCLDQTCARRNPFRATDGRFRRDGADARLEEERYWRQRREAEAIARVTDKPDAVDNALPPPFYSPPPPPRRRYHYNNKKDDDYDDDRRRRPPPHHRRSSRSSRSTRWQDAGDDYELQQERAWEPRRDGGY